MFYDKMVEWCFRGDRKSLGSIMAEMYSNGDNPFKKSLDPNKFVDLFYECYPSEIGLTFDWIRGEQRHWLLPDIPKKLRFASLKNKNLFLSSFGPVIDGFSKREWYGPKYMPAEYGLKFPIDWRDCVKVYRFAISEVEVLFGVIEYKLLRYSHSDLPACLVGYLCKEKNWKLIRYNFDQEKYQEI